MITIDHGGRYPTAYRVVDNVKRTVFDDVYYYALGDDPPHYPVPSTLGQCFIDHWVVDVFEANRQSFITAKSWYKD